MNYDELIQAALLAAAKRNEIVLRRHAAAESSVAPRASRRTPHEAFA
jgi:hypothetical protein